MYSLALKYLAKESVSDKHASLVKLLKGLMVGYMQT
jgi:hypothetical protein